MIARGLHHRLEGCGEHLLDEHVALRMRMWIMPTSQPAHRPRGDFGLAAVAEQQQRAAASSADNHMRILGRLVDEGQHLGPHLGEHIAEMFIIGADAA